MTHFYVSSSRTDNGKCSDGFEAAKVQLIRAIMAKMENTNDDEKVIEAAEAIGEAASYPYWSASGYRFVTCGSETWNILECNGYGCDDLTGERGW